MIIIHHSSCFLFGASPFGWCSSRLGIEKVWTKKFCFQSASLQNDLSQNEGLGPEVTAKSSMHDWFELHVTRSFCSRWLGKEATYYSVQLQSSHCPRGMQVKTQGDC